MDEKRREYHLPAIPAGEITGLAVGFNMNTKRLKCVVIGSFIHIAYNRTRVDVNLPLSM